MKIKPKHKRLFILAVCLASIFTGSFILLNTFRENLIYFYPPKDIEKMRVEEPERFSRLLKKQIRVGGMIKEKSYHKNGDLDHEFTITDFENDLDIKYHGILPPMFREGQGVIAQGFLGVHGSSGAQLGFIATQLITKHDEKYMPPEIKRSLEKNDK